MHTTLKYRIITHYQNKYQDLMTVKMKKQENKEIYKKTTPNHHLHTPKTH